MQFERNLDDNSKASLTFEVNERALVNRSLLSHLLAAATVGGVQALADSGIISICEALLSPEIFNAAGVRELSKEHIEALVEAVTESSRNMPYESVQEVGGLIAQLSFVSRVLEGSTQVDSELHTTQEIEDLVAAFEVPDSPEGLMP